MENSNNSNIGFDSEFTTKFLVAEIVIEADANEILHHVVDKYNGCTRYFINQDRLEKLVYKKLLIFNKIDKDHYKMIPDPLFDNELEDQEGSGPEVDEFCKKGFMTLTEKQIENYVKDYLYSPSTHKRELMGRLVSIETRNYNDWKDLEKNEKIFKNYHLEEGNNLQEFCK